MNPIPVLGALDSSFGFDNCRPTCLTINRGPFGKSVKNLPIRAVSFIDALRAPIAPPLIKPSSNPNLFLGLLMSFVM